MADPCRCCCAGPYFTDPAHPTLWKLNLSDLSTVWNFSRVDTSTITTISSQCEVRNNVAYHFGKLFNGTITSQTPYPNIGAATSSLGGPPSLKWYSNTSQSAWDNARFAFTNGGNTIWVSTVSQDDTHRISVSDGSILSTNTSLSANYWFGFASSADCIGIEGGSVIRYDSSFSVVTSRSGGASSQAIPANASYQSLSQNAEMFVREQETAGFPFSTFNLYSYDDSLTQVDTTSQAVSSFGTLRVANDTHVLVGLKLREIDSLSTVVWTASDAIGTWPLSCFSDAGDLYGTSSLNIRKLNAADGTTAWTTAISGMSGIVHVLFDETNDQVLVLGSASGGVGDMIQSFDATTGSKNNGHQLGSWSSGSPSGTGGSMAIVGSHVYVSTHPGDSTSE